MNIDELKKELKKNDINENACLIKPRICPEGALCLLYEENNLWSVVLNERGEYVVKENFISEDEACKFYFRYILLNPTYRKDFSSLDLMTYEKHKEYVNTSLKKYGYNPIE